MFLCFDFVESHHINYRATSNNVFSPSINKVFVCLIKKNFWDLIMMPLDLVILVEIVLMWGCHERFWRIIIPLQFLCLPQWAGLPQGLLKKIPTYYNEKKWPLVSNNFSSKGSKWIVAEMTDLKLLLWASCKVQDWSLSGKLWGSLEEIESLIPSTVFWNIFYWNGLLCTHGMLDITCNNYVYHNNQSRQLKWLMKLSLFWGNYEPKICLTCKQITYMLFR